MMILLAFGVIMLAGLARAVTGFGFALLAVPILGLWMLLPEAVALTILLQVVMLPRDVAVSWRQMDRRYLMWLMFGALPALPLGQIALLTIPPETAQIALVCLVIVAILLRWAPAPVASLIGRTPTPLVGALAGLMEGLAAMPGPPVVLHALATPLSPNQVRATLLMFFGVLAILSVPALAKGGAANKDTLILTLQTLPALLLSDWIGYRIAQKVKPPVYRGIATAILVVSAVVTIYPLLVPTAQ